jgi:hypothetical protein
MTQLPQTEIDRIKANALQHATDLHVNREDNLAIQSAYLAGAQAEAVRGREQERTRFIEFLQWLSAEKAEYSILYGGEPERFCSIDHDYTSEQIADLYILDTQKQKG